MGCGGVHARNNTDATFRHRARQNQYQTASAAAMASGSFPLRAYMQSFDGVLGPDYAPVAEELQHRGVEVILRSSESMIYRPLPLTRSDLVVGDFMWTRQALAQLGVAMPQPPDYPECLQRFLHRKVWQSTLGGVHALIESGACTGNVFIKPAEDTKAFSAIIEPKDRMIGMLLSGMEDVMSPLPASTKVRCAEVVNMVSEYRVYVVGGDIRHVAHYLGPDDGKLDMSVVDDAVTTFYDGPEAVASCGMDFAVLQQTDGSFVTCLVEVNDGYSLGVYKGLSASDHCDLLIARWHELVRRESSPV